MRRCAFNLLVLTIRLTFYAGEIAAWVDGGEAMILLCSTDGDSPSAGDNGHWLVAICTLDC